MCGISQTALAINFETEMFHSAEEGMYSPHSVA
ncbi:hypothetical protein HMPREF1222_02375 [Treponema vincentii F0403]|uniref:Uncharacterized protein n=1 Tax=Treponema vincentii F0403 TaxID=1125702 RepID=S3M9P3_9SPIR|nr:hypothetical protein HMPREF1222_02375 [Treponema vincentii F0403]